jgi:hypothetical protein
MRHVGSPLFAAILCRKLATVAAFSWYLPNHKDAAAIENSDLARPPNWNLSSHDTQQEIRPAIEQLQIIKAPQRD